MKNLLKIVVVSIALALMLIVDLSFLPVQLVPEADAILGVRRRTARRTAVVVGSAASAQTAAAQQQTAAAQQQPAAVAPPPAAAGKPLPLGTVVSALPPGCTSTPVGGVEYYYCSGNFYRTMFQGNTLVYVTTKPQ